MIKWFRSWFTMKRNRCLFVDKVSGKEVFLYTDCYGKEWMATYFYFGYRVPRNLNTK